MSAIAWEDLICAGRHVFWLNNRIDGSAAILHASTLMGCTMERLRVALVGRGNVAHGARSCLEMLCSGHEDEVLRSVYAVRGGVIADDRISRFQGR